MTWPTHVEAFKEWYFTNYPASRDETLRDFSYAHRYNLKQETDLIVLLFDGMVNISELEIEANRIFQYKAEFNELLNN